MPDSLQSDRTTSEVRVRAVAQYIPERSNPETDNFFFSYRITITNEGRKRIRLLTRHWIIINADGDREDVRGPGVIGQTPLLDPSESFEYTSFCPLNTEWGTMEGMYLMEDEDGERFDVHIGRFYLTTTVQVMN
jgi:ApaG protein